MGDRRLFLLNRQFMYALLARAFCEEPDDTLMDVLESEHAVQEFALASKAVSCDLTCQLEGIRAFIPEAVRGDGRNLAELRGQYTRIFLGPGAPVASPWESVHVTGRKDLFQPEVLGVREAYRQAGFLPARYPAVSDDFIGLELDFMAKLSQGAYASLEASDEKDSGLRLGQSRGFLRDHLLLWVDDLATSIREHQGASGRLLLFPDGLPCIKLPCVGCSCLGVMGGANESGGRFSWLGLLAGVVSRGEAVPWLGLLAAPKACLEGGVERGGPTPCLARGSRPGRASRATFRPEYPVPLGPSGPNTPSLWAGRKRRPPDT